MEAYDISIPAVESVGSMVVYEDGRPRSDYRKFRIKTVQGPNDYASMERGADAQVFPRYEGDRGAEGKGR